MSPAKRTRWGALTGGAVLVVGLAGCSRPENEVQPPPPAAEEKVPAAATDTSPAPAYQVAEFSLKALALSDGRARVEPPAGKVAPASNPTPAFDDAVTALLEHYHVVRARLAGDSLEGVKEAASALAGAVDKVVAAPSPATTDADKTALQEKLEAIRKGAQAVAQAPDIKTARHAFGDVSDAALYVLAFHYHAPDSAFPVVFYCPMVERAWFQNEQQMGNPYYGASMLTCGVVVPRA